MVTFFFASLVLNRPGRFLMWRHTSNSIGWGDLAWGRGCFFAVLLSYLAIELRQLVLIIWAADHRFREKQNRKSCCCQFRSKNDSLEWHSLALPCSQNYVRWCRPCSWHNYWRSFRNIRALRVLYYASFSSAIYLSQNAVEARRVLPYMGYIGMCRCEGYGFEAVYSGIGYINQRVWV